MTVFKRFQVSGKAKIERNANVETYPSESVYAAGQMASKQGDNTVERANYARILVKESQELSAYISQKSDRPLKKAS